MNRIRESRKAKSLTMKELAQKIGVVESTVSMYETGKREPDYATLGKIADALNVTIDYLLGRSSFVSCSNNEKCVDDSERNSINTKHLDSRLVELISDLTPIETEKAISYIEGMKSCREQKNPVHEDHAPGR